MLDVAARLHYDYSVGHGHSLAGFIGEPPMNFIRGTVENGILNASGMRKYRAR